MILNNHNMTEREFAECIEALQSTYETNQRTIENLRKELRELREEYDKDEEVAELKAEIEELQEELHLGFAISREEHKAINNWIEQHEIQEHGLITEEMRVRAQGVSGGRYTYYFLPTGLGTVGYVRCTCGKEFQFQDFI